MEAAPYLIQSIGKTAPPATFGANVGTGHRIIVSYECFNGAGCTSTPATVTDTLGTTFTNVIVNSTTHCGFLYIWYGDTIASGADTVTLSTTGSFQSFNISEWSGLTGGLDGTASTTSWTLGGAGTITSPSITTTANRSVVYVAANSCASGDFGPILPLQPVGTNGSADSMAVGWKLGATNGAYTGAFTIGFGSNGNVAIVAFKAQAALAVSTTTLPDGALTAPYRQQMQAVAGSGSYTWAITSGALPPGLSLASNGLITGTPLGSNTNNITFQVTDGASATATKVLTIHVGNSTNTIAPIQVHNACGGSLGTVTSGNLLLVVGGLSTTFGTPPTLTDTLNTPFVALPMSLTISDGSQNTASNFVMWGFAPSTGADTLACPSSPAPNVITIYEFSNVQQIFDPDASSLVLGSGGATITSTAITEQADNSLLYASATPWTSTATMGAVAPYTLGVNTASGGFSIRVITEYQVGGTSGSSQTASFTQSGNTDGNWGMMLLALRPTVSGTAPVLVSHPRAQVY